MISLTFEEIEQSRKSEAISFANWLRTSNEVKLNKPIEFLYEQFKKEIQ
jgi:uncharacterized membrane protein